MDLREGSRILNPSANTILMPPGDRISIRDGDGTCLINFEDPAPWRIFGIEDNEGRYLIDGIPGNVRFAASNGDLGIDACAYFPVTTNGNIVAGDDVVVVATLVEAIGGTIDFSKTSSGDDVGAIEIFNARFVVRNYQGNETVVVNLSAESFLFTGHSSFSIPRDKVILIPRNTQANSVRNSIRIVGKSRWR